ncbi:unnamed protein product [Owenia fusiformis]|uniref:Uncharacterized protein n=1 Tax=Owenia fusiformis TaxID=6347 RepID=A0A8J1TE08_OWEFU|nr:unnamed protein product [Owenia fusiformis]
MPPGWANVRLKSRESPVNNMQNSDSSKLLSILSTKSSKKQGFFPSIDPDVVKWKQDIRYKAAKTVISTSTTINHLPRDIPIDVLEQYNNRIHGADKIFNLPKVTMNYRVSHKKAESQFILKDNSAYTITKPAAFGGISSASNMSKPSLAISQDRMVVANMPDTLKLVKDHSLVYVYPGNAGPGNEETSTFRFPTLEDAIKAQEQKRLDKMHLKQLQITRKKELTLPDLKLHKDNSIFRPDRMNNNLPTIKHPDHTTNVPDRNLTLVPEIKSPIPENESSNVEHRSETMATINLGDNTPLRDIKDNVLRQRALTKNIAQKLANSSNSPGITVQEHTRGKVKLHIKQNISKRVEPIDHSNSKENPNQPTLTVCLSKPFVEPKLIPKPRSKPRLNPIQDHITIVRANIEKMRERIEKQKQELQREVEKRKRVHIEQSTPTNEQQKHIIQYSRKSPYRSTPQNNSEKRQIFQKEKISSFLSVPVKETGQSIGPAGKQNINTDDPGNHISNNPLTYTIALNDEIIEADIKIIPEPLPSIAITSDHTSSNDTTEHTDHFIREQSLLYEQTKTEEKKVTMDIALPQIKVETAETKTSISYQRDFSRWHTDTSRKQSTFLKGEVFGPNHHTLLPISIPTAGDVVERTPLQSEENDDNDYQIKENVIAQVQIDSDDMKTLANEGNYPDDASERDEVENVEISPQDNIHVEKRSPDNGQTGEVKSYNHFDNEQQVTKKNEDENTGVRFDNVIEIRERTYEAGPPSMDGFSSDDESNLNDLSEYESSVD